MKRKDVVVMAVILILMAAAFFLPEIVAFLEDYTTLDKTEHYKVEKVNLTPDESYFLKKLQEAQDGFASERTYVDLGGEMTEKEVLASIEELLELLAKEDKSIAKFDLSNFITPSQDMQSLYSIWDCYVMDEEENHCFLLIDDDTGKVLSFSCPMEMVGGYTEKVMVDVIMDTVGKYYGFSDVQIMEVDLIEKEMSTLAIATASGTSDTSDAYKLSFSVIQRYGYFYFNIFPELAANMISKSLY